MSITYTFGADCPVDELRGMTATDGVFCNIDHRFIPGRDPDAVRFVIDGRQVIVKIAGRPELEAALAEAKAEKDRVTARLAEIGWPQYEAALLRMEKARDAYDRASERGYPSREAGALKHAEAALAQTRVDYPLAALYALAKSYARARNPVKAKHGCDAMRAIETGGDPADVIAKMQAAWDEYCHRSLD